MLLPPPPLLLTDRASSLFVRGEEKKERASTVVVFVELLKLLVDVEKVRLGDIIGLVDTFTAFVPGIESVFSRLWPCSYKYVKMETH